MKKIFGILTVALMLTTVSFAQQSQTDTTHKSTTKKSAHTHSTTHKSSHDSTGKSTTKQPQ